MRKDLRNQNFSGQDLRGKKIFSNANLQGANFYKANLQKVDFSNAELQGANFEKANLREANFTNTSADKVNFRSAHIQGVNFTDAKLIGSDFTGSRAGLSRFWSFGVILFSVILCFLSAFPTAIVSTFSVHFFYYYRKKHISISVFVGMCSVIFTMAIRQILLTLEPHGSLVNKHVSFGVIMMLMVLSGTIAATAINDDQNNLLDGVVWYTLASLVMLVYIDLPEIDIQILPSFLSKLIKHQHDVGLFGAIIGAFFGCWFAKEAISENNKFKWLWKIYIQLATCRGTVFKSSNLTNATFKSANIRGANFKNSKIEWTIWHEVKYLEYAYLVNGYFKYSRVRKIISQQNLENKDKIFNALNLKGINLEDKNLHEAKLQQANLEQANLRNADLTHATLQQANLKQANLRNAKLTHATLQQANLEQANLRNAKLMHATLQQAKLNGADLTGASLTGACIHDWSIDEETILSQVKCEYIYQEQLPDTHAGYRRFPPSPRTFRAGEFEKIFRKDQGTIQLFIRSDDNKEALMAAIEKLKQNTDSAFQGLERVGEDFLLKIELPENLNTSTVEEIENRFYLNYNTVEENLKNKSGSKQDENLSITNIFEFLLEVLKILGKPTINNTNINNSKDFDINTVQDNSQVENNKNTGK